jgi:ATP-binding cassette subfamily C protein
VIETEAPRGTYSDLRIFAQRYFAADGRKLAAVIGLEALLSAITGVGLLLILPLLGLLGLGPGGADHPFWGAVTRQLGELGVRIDLGSGLALFVAAVGLRAILVWRRQTWQVEVEQHFQASLRNRLYQALAAADLSFLQRLRTSELVHSIQSEIRRAQQAANTLFLLVSQALNIAAHFAVALVLSVPMTLLALACGVVSALLLLPVVRQTHRLGAQEMRVRSSMINNLIEHIQGLRAARALGLTGKFVDDYRALSNRAAAVNVRLSRLSAYSNLVFEAIAVVLTAAIVYVSLAVLHVEAARFLVLLLIFVRIFPAIGRLQNDVQQFAALLPSFRHYLDLLEALSRHARAPEPAATAERIRLEATVEFRGVTFAYDAGREPVLQDVGFTIEKGQLVAIAGHSGAGKSTLADIATGLLTPSSGQVLIDGVPLTDSSRALWTRETALVPQDGFLFNGSIRDNLRCVKPDATDAQLWQALEAVNASDFVRGRARGLDGDVGERGALISGGERQRLSIARALLREPQLLVLDEPTNNLDARSVEALLEAIENLRGRTTLLVISHDARVLECADLVVEFRDGRSLGPKHGPRFTPSGNRLLRGLQ